MATQAPSPAAPTGGTLASPKALSPSSNNRSTSGNSTSPPPQIQTPPSVPPASSPPPTSSPPVLSPLANSTSPPPPTNSASPPPPTNSTSPPPVSAPPVSSSPPSNSSASPPSSPPPASSPPPSPPAIVSPPVQSPPPTAAASPPPPKSASPPTSSPPLTTLSPPPSTTKPSTPPTAAPPSKSKSPSPPSSESPPPPPSSESPTPSPPAASPPLSPPTPIVVSPSPKSSTPESPSPNASPSPPEATTPTSTPPPPATITPRSPPSSKSPPSTGHPPPQSLSPPPNSATNTRTESSPSSGGGVSGAAVAGITVGVLVVLAFVVIGGLSWCRRKKKRDLYPADYYTPPPPGSFSRKSDVIYGSSSSRSDQHLVKPPVVGYGYDNGYKGSRGSVDDVVGVPGPQATTSGLGNSKSWFTYEELAIATNGFSPQNVLGEGGFGCVYKGYLQDGKVVAVKQLKRGSGQGEREFRAEVEIISRVHHRHLVSLVGYCIADSQRLLVYDYVPNGTLEYHLHGSGRPVMDWPTRLKIAVGAARGIAYLHEDCHPRIIHRDIKSANILLDDRFEAQVSDFGLAKLALDTNTHVTTRVMGTFGYMAPEYASSGKLTQRSDVFSFGVVLLELLTGRKPVDTSQPLGDESLVEWARPLLSHALEGGDFEGIVDPRLENNYNQIEMFRMIEAAAACVRHSAQRRPGMGQVVRALESDNAIADLNNGVKPGQSTMYNSAQYSIDIRRFRRMAFGSHEYGSDFSGLSAEHEMTRSTSSSEFHKSKEAEVKHSRQQKRDMDVQSASGSEFPSSESETRPINVSQSHKDEIGERSSGEVPITFGSEPLRGR